MFSIGLVLVVLYQYIDSTTSIRFVKTFWRNLLLLWEDSRDEIFSEV
jgi:hypothetical protein